MAEATATVVAANPAEELAALRVQFQAQTKTLQDSEAKATTLQASLTAEKAATTAAIAEGQKQVAIAAKTGSKTGAQNNVVNPNPVMDWVNRQYAKAN